MRNILLILFLLIGVFSYGQTLQYVNTYGFDFNKFKSRDLLGLPNDTFTVPASLQDVKWVARKGTTTYFWNTTTFIWEASTSVTTASEGLTVSGDDVTLGGEMGTSIGYFNTSRIINTDHAQMYWSNGLAVQAGGNDWITGNPPYSPYQFWSKDTVTTSHVPDPPNATVPLSGIFARRIVHFEPGALALQKLYGHYFGQEWNWTDTMVFRTEGGDYNQAVTVEQVHRPLGTSRQVERSAFGTGNDTRISYALPALIAQHFFKNTSGNRIYARGHYSGVNSYLVAGSAATDTIERYVHYTTNNFLGNSSKVLKIYLFAPGNPNTSSVTDSAFGWYDTSRVVRSFHAGRYLIGWGDSTVTGYNFKVTGATYLNGSVNGKQGVDVASTAGVMTLGEDGNVFEITGTNTITAISNTNKKNGYVVTLLFTSTATLTDGTANSGSDIGIELDGNTNFVGSAGDSVTMVLSEIGGTQRWREISRSLN